MCCLFGLIDYKNALTKKKKERIIKVLSQECEARGTDATGIAYISAGEMSIYKQPLPAHSMKFKFRSSPSVIMGHTRMTTQGSEEYNFNNHPFYSKSLGFALAHNGVIYNDTELRKIESLPKTKIETDSYIAVQLIDKKKTLDFESLKYMAEKVEGSFCFTVLSPDNELYIVKGNNPMAIAQFNGFYMYASTSAILQKAVKKLGMKRYKMLEIKEGDIFKFNTDGSIAKDKFETWCREFHPSWGSLSNSKRNKRPVKQDVDRTYLDDIIFYAKCIGLDEKFVMDLYYDGYTCMEIEDILCDIDCCRLEMEDEEEFLYEI